MPVSIPYLPKWPLSCPFSVVTLMLGQTLGPALVFSFIMHTFPITAVFNEDISCISAATKDYTVHKRRLVVHSSRKLTSLHVVFCILRLSTAVLVETFVRTDASTSTLASQLHSQRLHDHVYYTESCGEFTANFCRDFAASRIESGRSSHSGCAHRKFSSRIRSSTRD